ncbi:MAG: thioredoxin [Rhodospirillales bacterium CG15_BIG_FIL_POST_REV_8_21_14_020_66_15]|nr:MAG: thioredoxin [Rhodospirillales bacterium CG15_BIG_FIL_POST_REV_8_21_14_020_66_15]
MRRFLTAAVLLLAVFGPARAATVGEDGLHKQSWFAETFLILAEDMAEAAAKGKRVAVIFEQKGCPYCREMHTVNFQVPELTDYVKAHFMVVQLNLWGAREVTDLDGKALEERALARRWRVNFTPTIVFLPTPEEMKAGETEVARMPGYFKPFHFQSMFEFVKAGAYKEQSFQRFLQHKFEDLEKQGKKPKVW